MASPAPEEGYLKVHNAEPDGGDANGGDANGGDASGADDEDHPEWDEDGAEGDGHHETYPADNKLPLDDSPSKNNNSKLVEDSDPDEDASSEGNYSNDLRHDPIDFNASVYPANASWHSSNASSHSSDESTSSGSSRPHSAASSSIHSRCDPFESSARRQGPAAQVRSTYVASRFQNHRQGLRRELESLKDQKGDRLYTDAQIDRQLSCSKAEEPPQNAQHDLDDSTFGKIGSIGYFSDVKSRRPKFSSFRFPVSKMTINDSAFTESEQGTGPWNFRWVHLPANNFEWVYMTMHHIYKRHGRESDPEANNDAAEKLRNQILRREMFAERRAAREAAPCHARHLRPSCHKIRISTDFPDERRTLHKYKKNLSLSMPYLHWEYSIARHHTMRIIEDARQVAEGAEDIDGLGLQAAEISALPCEADEKMLRYHIPGRSWLHMRRTLDQSYYPTLQDTHLRDQGQVVDRYSRKHHGDYWKEPRVLMVDQLWLWVLGGHTVLTCFPKTWTHAMGSDDPTDIFVSIQRYLQDPDKRRWIKNAEELAYCIVDRCAANIYDSELMPDQRFDFLEMFRRSIADLMDSQTFCFSHLPIVLEPGTGADNPFEAATEFQLLAEAKDILDELEMIRDINKQQTSVLKLLADSSLGAGRMQNTRKQFFLRDKPKARAETVKDLCEKADAAYNAIIHLLDLKQKQANIFEARSATKMVRESEKSGETIMLFTVITILFLPLSTLASIFGLNAKELNAGNLSLGVVFAYIFPISVFIVVGSFVVVFNDAARKAVIAPFTKRREARENAERQRVVASITSSPPDYTATYTDLTPKLASVEKPTSRRRPWRRSLRESTTSAV